MKLESLSAPLTIFYGSRIMVFDDFSAEKAKEVIDLANKGSAKSFTGFTAQVNNIQSAYTQSLAKNQKEIASSPNPVPSPAKTAAQETIQPNPASLACGIISQPLWFNNLSDWLSHISLTFSLFDLQNFRLLEELRFTGSLRRGRIGNALL